MLSCKLKHNGAVHIDKKDGKVVGMTTEWGVIHFKGLRPGLPNGWWKLAKGTVVGGNNQQSQVGSFSSNATSILGVGGLSLSAAEHIVQTGKQWLGKNGKFYSLDWGGNGYTGARSVAIDVAKRYRIAGKSIFYLSAAISFVEGSNALYNNDYAGVGKSSLDIGFGAYGTWGGIPGIVAGSAYMLLDDKIKTMQSNPLFFNREWNKIQSGDPRFGGPKY